MIILNHRISPVQLSNLGCENLAIQTQDSTPGKLTAFFDFDEILILDSHTCDTIWGDFSAGNLQPKLSFAGWVGFFGYEFLAHHFGVQLDAKKDLSVPSLWFGRPQSLVTLEADQTIIESSDETREQDCSVVICKMRIDDPWRFPLRNAAKSLFGKSLRRESPHVPEGKYPRIL